MPHPMQAARLALSHKLTTRAEHLTNDTHFTLEECKCLLVFHQRMTMNGNLDRNRFREVLSTVFDITDDVMLDFIFRSFDRDSDGFVDDMEFVKGFSIMLRGTLEQLIEFTYFVYDMNGDRSLAREELHHCLKGCIHGGFGLDDDEVDECEREIVELAMRKLDVDHDGQITFEDFTNAVNGDPLLLQACGPCLPSSNASAAFLALMTDRYRSYSNIYPGMPLAKVHLRNAKSIWKKSRIFAVGAVASKVSKILSDSSIGNIGIGGAFSHLSKMNELTGKKSVYHRKVSNDIKAALAPIPKKLTNAAQEAFGYRMKMEMAEQDGSKKYKLDPRMYEIVHDGVCSQVPKKKKGVARHSLVPEDKICREEKAKKGKRDGRKGTDKKKDGCELSSYEKRKLEKEAKKKKKLEDEAKKKKKLEQEAKKKLESKVIRKVGQPSVRLYNPIQRPMLYC